MASTETIPVIDLGPYLAGYRSQHGGDMWIEGRRLFYAKSGHPDIEFLILARAGILPFMILCLVLVWVWTSRYVGPAEGAHHKGCGDDVG